MNALNAVKFPEANKNLAKPPLMTDKECGGLWVYNDGQQCISCWKLTLRQRIFVLIHGRVWLSILSGHTQPPVWLDCSRTVFARPEEGAEK